MILSSQLIAIEPEVENMNQEQAIEQLEIILGVLRCQSSSETELGLAWRGLSSLASEVSKNQCHWNPSEDHLADIACRLRDGNGVKSMGWVYTLEGKDQLKQTDPIGNERLFPIPD